MKLEWQVGGEGKSRTLGRGEAPLYICAEFDIEALLHEVFDKYLNSRPTLPNFSLLSIWTLWHCIEVFLWFTPIEEVQNVTKKYLLHYLLSQIEMKT